MQIVMIKIAICDTSECNRKRIASFCDTYLKNKFIEYQVQEYTSGEALLAESFPDVLFLDTKLKYIDGILTKEILHKMKSDTRIIFISNENDKMPNAFGKNVYAFLPKTLGYGEFQSNMLSVMIDISEQKNMVYCKNQKTIEKIFLRDVLYIKAYGRYSKIYLYGEEEYKLSDKSFGEWYLDMEHTEFVSCHRSYLVNLFYIRTVKKEIELINGACIPIGEKKREEFYTSYREYLERK